MKGPCRKEETKKDTLSKKDQKEKKTKSKLINTILKNDHPSIEEICKSRKRKERQESVSSLCNERKAIRSNSEERPRSRKHAEHESIRRVSSSDDLQNSKNKATGDSERKEIKDDRITSVLDEFEHENRRWHERFSKPLTLKCKKGYTCRRSKGKSLHKSRYHNSKERKSENHFKNEKHSDEHSAIKTEKNEPERQKSPLNYPECPIISTFDLTTLHQQVDDVEALPSCSNKIIETETAPSLSMVPSRLLSSPRNSIIATHCIRLDTDTIYSNMRKSRNPVEMRLKKISKQINALKKGIRKFENEFGNKHGRKPNYTEKINDDKMKQFYTDIAQLKKEYKQLQDSNGDAKMQINKNEISAGKSLRDLVNELEIKLKQKRELANRSFKIEKMTPEELLEEKVALQKALLHLESMYGRPNNKDDRDVVRPLYDRYRNLKRTLARNSTGQMLANDLETIHEDETINFVVELSMLEKGTLEKLSSLSTTADSTDTTDTDVSVNENLHALSRNELVLQLKATVEEKKVLKRAIKEYEFDVQQKTGKMLQKEDKIPIQQLYKNYKKIKSKIKLLEALLVKQK